MTSHQPDRRDLFDTQAAPLYDEIVAAGGMKVDDPRIAEDSPQRPGFDLLVDTDEWKAEIPQIQEWFEKFGEDLPAVLWTELDGLKARLGV